MLLSFLILKVYDMKDPKIRLALRVVIGQNSASLWEKYIFEDTYKEYIMQQQRFNDKENPAITFRELLAVNPEADQLHSLEGTVAEVQFGVGEFSRRVSPIVRCELDRHPLAPFQ